MGKKLTKKEAEYAAQVEAARRQSIAQFNLENENNLYVDENRIPTDEDCKAAKDAFEKKTKEVQEGKEYLIADAPNALRVAKFLKNFVENSFWTQRYWVGIINFVKLIDTFIEECEKEAKPLMLEYGPLQFCSIMLENYAGFGMKDAKHMAEIWDEYVPIYDTMKGYVNEYAASVKECNVLQQIWNMMEQGYYTIQLEPKNEQGVADASVSEEE